MFEIFILRYKCTWIFHHLGIRRVIYIVEICNQQKLLFLISSGTVIIIKYKLKELILNVTFILLSFDISKYKLAGNRSLKEINEMVGMELHLNDDS